MKNMNTTNSVLIICILLAVVITVGIVAVLLYRRKVNRALSGEQSGAHTNIPAPSDTIGVLFKVVTLILLVWVCISMGRLNTLQDEIENMRNDAVNNSLSINQEINSLKEELKSMNSMVSEYSVECGSIDASDNTCLVKHVIRLKSFSDDTKVVFDPGDGSEAVMTKTGEGRYEAELKADLFKGINGYPGITVTENGKTTYEKLDNGSYLGNDYWKLVVPSIINQFGFEYTDDNFSIGTLSLFSEYRSDYHIKSAEIVIEKNGETAETIDVLSSFSAPFGNIEIPVNKEYAATKKDTVNVRLILKTEEGYTLEQLLFNRTENRNTNYGYTYTIKDTNGNKVYPY